MRWGFVSVSEGGSGRSQPRQDILVGTRLDFIRGWGFIAKVLGSMRREGLGLIARNGCAGEFQGSQTVGTMVKCAQCGLLVEQELGAERCLTPTVFSRWPSVCSA